MDLANMLSLCLVSCVLGGVLVLIFQYVMFVSLTSNNDEDDSNRFNKRSASVLPSRLMAGVDLMDNEQEKEQTLLACNLIFQFLFYEMRDLKNVRKWFYKKLSEELNDLTQNYGKIFDKLTIRDLELGSHFPDIKSIKIQSTELHKNGHIEHLDLILDVNYEGNFRLSIDAEMVLGKRAFLSVKVKELNGSLRLQFTRKPYTHWSLTFIEEPKLVLDVESKFQGRQLQSNAISLITNQIKKAIRRKHTLPNRKIRYKPFFHVPDDEELDVSDTRLKGSLEVSLFEISRLRLTCPTEAIFAVVTLAPLGFVSVKQIDETTIAAIIDIEIHKAKNQQIGIVFKQVERGVVVESVLPNTPAAKADIQKEDFLILFDSCRITHINQVAKIMRSSPKLVLMMRLERNIPGIIHSDLITDAVEMSECAIETTKPEILNVALNERLNSSESSKSNTPSNSPSRRLSDRLLQTMRAKVGDRSENEVVKEEKVISSYKRTSIGNHNCPTLIQHSSQYYPSSNLIEMNDTRVFQLDSSTSHYLNVHVYGKYRDEDVLLGYTAISTNEILSECRELSLQHNLKRCFLSAPNAIDISTLGDIKDQSGFDPFLCYGDILLSFSFRTETDRTGISETTNVTSNAEESLHPFTDDKEEYNQVPHPKEHEFIRTHFHSATVCDFCGKKIWLKEAMQCKNCAMSCHKKCLSRCISSTICNEAGVENDSHAQIRPELKFTEATAESLDDSSEVIQSVKDRSSLGDFISQGIKRINSANNLSIPGLNLPNSNSKSLPPSPQHCPSAFDDPFVAVTERLEEFPEKLSEMTIDSVIELTEPLLMYRQDDLMALAKVTSKTLYDDFPSDDRLKKINNLMNKIHVALDFETSAQKEQDEQSIRTLLPGKSDERVQILSIIMLFLCNALQQAQQLDK